LRCWRARFIGTKKRAGRVKVKTKRLGLKTPGSKELGRPACEVTKMNDLPGKDLRWEERGEREWEFDETNPKTRKENTKRPGWHRRSEPFLFFAREITKMKRRKG